LDLAYTLSLHDALPISDGGLMRVAEAMLASAEYAERIRAAEERVIPPSVLENCLKALGRDLLIVDVGAQKLSSEEHVYAALVSTDRKSTRLNSSHLGIS